ncbi:WXG100 family type VII secretion target [Streptomyces sp. JW3]|uniref:WXG100 family type VII secretion target n=1 Tax=Streptomyces sp. JW3 TaxID=3456955 RepID=UPI003FA40B94
MGFDTFDVDTAVLRQQGQNFVQLGDGFSKASKGLQDTLEGLGEPWADAGFGEIFGQVYTPIRDGIIASMEGLAERLGTIGYNLQDMAQNYDGSDASNSGLLNGISGRL